VSRVLLGGCRQVDRGAPRSTTAPLACPDPLPPRDEYGPPMEAQFPRCVRCMASGKTSRRPPVCSKYNANARILSRMDRESKWTGLEGVIWYISLPSGSVRNFATAVGGDRFSEPAPESGLLPGQVFLSQRCRDDGRPARGGQACHAQEVGPIRGSATPPRGSTSGPTRYSCREGPAVEGRDQRSPTRS
jgi:hypothetical protein